MAHFLDRFLGDANKRVLKQYEKQAETVEGLENDFKSLSDEELKSKTTEFKNRLSNGESLDSILAEAFAAVREASRRTLGQFHFPVQILGGMALHFGNIAEMRTGEGKTLTATLPTYLNALEGKGVHIVTVNDYLAKRDAVWMGQIHYALGLSVGCIQHEGGYVYDPSVVKEEPKEDEVRDLTGSFKVEHEYLRQVSRREAYEADITYGTNNEFGFDYLRDNMVSEPAQMVQRGLNYAIVDEVDSILIDEARTPLIISAPAEDSNDMYRLFATLVPRLVADTDYNIDEKMKTATLTETGISKMEEWLGVANLYADGGVKMVHHLEQALRAEVLYKKDREYVVRGDEIVIVDEFTGRMMEGRRFSEGLHQAIEAKEGVKVQRESQTLGTITFQNYFRMYEKLSGMTGTAKTEEEEFQTVYDINVVVLPTNRASGRKDEPDRIYKTRNGKLLAVAEEVKAAHELGEPILLGTVSIEQNEELSAALQKAGVPHEVLNAKNHEREGQIIAQAGRKGSVTVATNMAGRGVDIVLGGNPSTKEEQEEVKTLGGLYVIGTERHEARRIDNQLRGRAGRQGDPGRTRFFVSLEDDLMRIFGGERMKGLMERLGVPDDMPIENSMISKSIESAQKRVEGHNFDTRKRLLDFDTVLNKQREAVYGMRREVVFTDVERDPIAIRPLIAEHFTSEIENIVAFHTSDASEWNVKEIIESAKTMVVVPDSALSVLAKYDGVAAPRAELAAKARTEITAALDDAVSATYGKVEQAFDDRKELARFERELLLRSIDALWVEHLDAMRKLRSAVGLEGYAQRDPLVAYKKESYRMFQQMLAEVQKQIVYSFFKIADAISAAKSLQASGQTLSERVGLNVQAAAQNTKIGRNDPCHCGSGKKFKKCHGA
ncbi:MAG: preprotein translocase subunit SecA [Patescibacteria group bacterium]